MKKQIVGFVGIVALFVAGCGGGGSSSISYDDPQVIVDQDFYRVKLEDFNETYIKELFDDNNTLHEGIYDMDHELIPDTNRTIPYLIDGSYVQINDDPAIRCKVIESNVSVEFWCLPVGASGSLTLYTTRWKTLEDAMENPEE